MTIGRTRFRKVGFQPLSGTILGTEKYGGLRSFTCSIPSPFDVLYFEKCVDQTNPGPPYHKGGRFQLYQAEIDQIRSVGKGRHLYMMQIGGPNYYDGSFIPNIGLLSPYISATDLLQSDFSKNPHSSNFDQSLYSAKEYASASPGSPGVQLGVAIAEFRDMPRMLSNTAKGFHNIWKSMGGSFRHWSPKEVANQFLNEQFGWLPFLGDLRRFVRTAQNLNNGLAQARHDNARWVHRRRVLGTIRSKSKLGGGTSYAAGLLPVLNTYAYRSQGNWEVWVESEADHWFSGEFKYYVPDIDTDDFARRYKWQQLGLSLTPSLIWEALPWSWLIDWGTNIGDILQNISNQSLGWASNLVSRNAYSMGTTRKTYTLSTTAQISDGPIHGESRVTATWKSRQLASPFGFGYANWASFSARQLAILTALGIVRT